MKSPIQSHALRSGTPQDFPLGCALAANDVRNHMILIMLLVPDPLKSHQRQSGGKNGDSTQRGHRRLSHIIFNLRCLLREAASLKVSGRTLIWNLWWLIVLEIHP